MTTQTDHRELRLRRRQEIEAQRRAAESAQRNEELRRSALIIGIILGVALAIAAGVFLVSQLFAPPARIGELRPDFGALHQPPRTPIEYQEWPPASGTHYFQWADPGVYRQPIAPGFWVHSLEHGYAVLLYRCEADCEAVQARLDALFGRLPKSRVGYPKFIAVPDDRIETPFFLVAWRYWLPLEHWDEAKIIEFYRSHLDRGPEPNAP